ncbi:MAG TPA: L,D-transpeptidase [Gemmatimonadaceae bacterium]
MTTYRKALAALLAVTGAICSETASAQVELPRIVAADRDSAAAKNTLDEPPISLQANLGARILTVRRGDSTLRTYAVAVGNPRYPTPQGFYRIREIVWNPSWRPPPGADWAKGKKPQGPGDPKNPMKVVKIFFREPDYYIHGTDDVESLGSAESHGCLRMDPSEAADLAKMIMENGGQPRGENWFWRIIHFRSEQKVVYLDNPIWLTVVD